MAIYQDLVDRFGFAGAYNSVPGVNYFDLSASIILSGAVGR